MIFFRGYLPTDYYFTALVKLCSGLLVLKNVSFRKAAAVSNVCTEEICVVLRGKGGRDDTLLGRIYANFVCSEGRGR